MKFKTLLFIIISLFSFQRALSQSISTSDTITINISVPNVYSEGEHGIWKDFYVEKLDNSEILKFDFKIFDRWGQLVFESMDIKKGWDGIYKKEKLPMSVYVYELKMEVYDPLARQKIKKLSYNGTITLIR